MADSGDDDGVGSGEQRSRHGSGDSRPTSLQGEGGDATEHEASLENFHFIETSHAVQVMLRQPRYFFSRPETKYA